MGSAQILSLVEDALAVGLDGTGHFSLCPQAADLRADVLERSWHAVRLQGRFAEKVDRLQMELRVAPCVPRRTAADVTRCCQVVMNLLTNAVKFAADEGGSVEMSAAYDAATEARARLNSDLERAQQSRAQRSGEGGAGDGFIRRRVCALSLFLLPRHAASQRACALESSAPRPLPPLPFPPQTLSVAVRDNGRGLSAEGLGKLFKPFSQAEGEVTKATFGGTGLGLVICRDITRAMAREAIYCGQPAPQPLANVSTASDAALPFPLLRVMCSILPARAVTSQ